MLLALCCAKVSWGCVWVVLSLMHLLESWGISRGVQVLPVACCWQGISAGTLGLLPLEALSCPFSAVHVTGERPAWPVGGAFTSGLSLQRRDG